MRVVDIWGPGRVPLVVRSWTGQRSSPSGAGNWQFNHHLDASADQNRAGVLEPDGNLSLYKPVNDGCDGPPVVPTRYVKDVGTYSTLEIQMSCLPGDPWEAYYGERYTVSLPKGVVKKFRENPPTPGDSTLSPGLITEERDANGNLTTYAWTSLAEQDRHYIASVTDPVGRVTSYAYEGYRRECAVINEETGGCRQWRTYYRVNAATDPYGRRATYTYNAAGQIASVTNAAGFTTSYSYDASSRLTSITNARGNTTTIAWTTGPDGAARVASVTAPDGSATRYAYPSTAQTVVTDARGNATTYDISNNDVVKVTNPLGHVTRYAYDTRHNVTQVTDARGVTTTYAYNSRNKVTQVVQASGSLNLTTSLSWDGADNLLSVTNPRGIRTDYTYDSAHNLTSVRRAVGTADEALTQYTYTSWGGVASMTDPRGHTTTYTYTARRQLQTITPPAGGQTSFGYNMVDDQVSMTNGNGQTWSTTYNASRLVTGVTDPLNHKVSHEYDANGNRTKTVDPKLQATAFAYDNRDRLTAITDALGGKTTYAYDAVSNLTKITNARGHATALAYDAANRLTQVTDALGQITTYGYDAVGNRTAMKDRKGTTHTYAYDQANRLTQVSAGGITISYTYDANGNRLTLADPTGTTSYSYDALDRLTKTAYPDGRSVQAAYDKAGNRTRLTYPGGTVSQSSSYDAANRLTAITQGTLQWTIAYDGAGNRTRLTSPNGVITDYAYLANNWLSSIAHKGPGGSTFQSFSYTYDANGNRVSQTDPTGTTSFSYDALNRLTQAAYPAGYGTWAWAYDAVGNRTSQSAPGGTTSYTYDANNRLTSSSGVTYSYDANGNLTGSSAGQSFSYDPFNRMTQSTTAGGQVTYTYNGDGLKVKRVGPDGTTLYYHDGLRPIWETDGAGTVTVQLDRDLFGNLLSRRESALRRYYHTDGLGSTTALTDESGAAVATMLYDAWGSVRTNSGSGHGKYRYTGAEFDSASGFYHMGARFYDPSLGRWLSEGPVQNHPFNPLSLNFYAYVQNNPLILVDPTGKQTCDRTCLERLNEQRQQAAKLALETSDAVAFYAAYLEISRTVGHETAMAALFGVGVAQSKEVLASLPIGPSASRFVSKDLVRAIYVFAASQFALYEIVEWGSILYSIGRNEFRTLGSEAIRNPFAGRYTYALLVAFYLDNVFHEGAVWREFLDWLMRRRR